LYINSNINTNNIIAIGINNIIIINIDIATSPVTTSTVRQTQLRLCMLYARVCAIGHVCMRMRVWAVLTIMTCVWWWLWRWRSG